MYMLYPENTRTFWLIKVYLWDLEIIFPKDTFSQKVFSLINIEMQQPMTILEKNEDNDNSKMKWGWSRINTETISFIV